MSELLQTLLSNPYFLILLCPVTTLTFFVVGLVLMDLKYLKKPDRNQFFKFKQAAIASRLFKQVILGGITQEFIFSPDLILAKPSTKTPRPTLLTMSATLYNSSLKAPRSEPKTGEI